MSGVHVHVQSSPLSLATTTALIVAASVYLRGWLRLRRAFPISFASWRLAAFVSALFLVWITAASPLATLDHQSLTIHMVKHLVLMTVAAPLTLAGTPIFLLYGLSRWLIQSDTLNPTTQWLERCLSYPVLCWLVGTSTVIGWHFPAALQLALQSPWTHSMQDASFLLAGLVFWRPVMQPLLSATSSPRWFVPLYLFLATLPCDILSAFLVFCNRPVYSSYLSTAQLFSLSALKDQECAGALMWVWVTFAYLIPAVVIIMQILSPSNELSFKAVHSARPRLTKQSLNSSEPEVL
jgi:putative membrane protein